MSPLFNYNNAKTHKGEAFGWRTAILYLAPSKVAGNGIDVCEHSTAECRAFCLNTAGLAGVFKSIQESRIRKTRWMMSRPEEFWNKVHKELLSHENLTYRMQHRLKRKLRPACRINGTSDLWNEHIQSLMHKHPDIQFYDYTKDIKRIIDFTMGKLPLNYHLTYSYGGGDTSNAMWCLDNKVNVAVVFDTKRGEPLPDYHWGVEVVDGDTHDLRFLNQPVLNKGYIIGLRAKGKAVNKNGKSESFIQKGVVS